LNWQEATYLFPYIMALLLSLSVAHYTWRRRSVPTTSTFAWYAYAQTAMVLGFILELLSPDLPSKIFWDNFQWVGIFVALVALFLFTVQHTGYRPPYYRRLLTASVVFSGFSLLLIYTDRWHGLLRPTAVLIPGEPFDALYYDFSPATWMIFIGCYLIVFYSLALLTRSLWEPRPLYRAQTRLILLGAALPTLGTLLTLLGVVQTFQRDITPFALAAGNLIIAWGIFRYRVFDILPVARDAVIESMQDAVVVLDPDWRIVDANPAVQQWTGRTATAVVGLPFQEVFPHWQMYLLLENSPSSQQKETQHVTSSGTSYLTLAVTPLTDRHGRLSGQILVIHDITARKQAEEELNNRAEALVLLNAEIETANKHLQALSQVKDQFVANVSHELRTPITNLKLCLDLLKLNGQKSDIYLSILGRETERLENLIESLLLLSRLDRTAMSLNFLPQNLNWLVEKLVHDRMTLASQKSLALKLSLTPDLPLVQVDASLMERVLDILLTNSMNYTPADGMIWVSTSWDAGREMVGLSVQDTGPGVPPAEQKQLFQRFFRGQAANDTGTAGTGLGLAIANEIVGLHRGQIDVYSPGEPGEGACFTVWLPSFVETETGGEERTAVSYEAGASKA